VIANLVTATRLVLALPLFALLLTPGAAAAWAALGVLALAGLTDVVDGRIARALGQVSKLGAMLDLVADRVLTATLAAGLIANGTLAGWWAAPVLVLLARDLAVASFGEAGGGAVKFPVTALERVKITLQFVGFLALVAPPLAAWQGAAGRWSLAASATLAAASAVSYGRRTAQALKSS
jgi:CDP-diacylglycerol--glycerol-3-phosphate 3-phosphatidyltransferase